MELGLSKEQQLILIGLIASIIIGSGVMLYRNYSNTCSNDPIIQPSSPPPLMVHLSGAVKREGVYKLAQGDRLLDAVNLAGGALPNADLSAINLAEIAKDGEKIVVPVKPTAIAGGSGDQGNGGPGTLVGKVNINSADEKSLDSLPGVGPSTAKAIVEYRRTNGPFNRIEQIMEIPRFGKSKFERIKDRITV